MSAPCVCSLHGSALIIFCDRCRELLCEDCLTSDEHRNHGFVRLRDACKEQIDEVTKQAQKLSIKYTKTSDVIARVSKTKKYHEEKFDKATMTVNNLYEELIKLIKKNQEQALLLIRGLKESRGMGLDRLAWEVDKTNQRAVNIGKAVARLRQNLEGNNVSTLLEIKGLQSSIEAVDDFYKMLEETTDADTTRLRALVNSVEKILQKNQKLLPRPWEFAENLTFDEKTADSNLSTSGDKTQVRYSNRLPSKGAKSFANILAAQCFTSGRHYWEVEVKGAESWTVGVVEQGWQQKGNRRALGEDCQSWGLQLDSGRLLALHDDEATSLKGSEFERLGIFLDSDKGQLQFYDVVIGQALHIFYNKFKNSVHPAFSVGHEGGITSQLILCHLVPQHQHLQANLNNDSET
ncbi:E3 ubiquitin-protein ligase TRIM39-like [Brienomyrus brachyistius]|uniref:E3 ubiquitin-protein ligase TRIM39-like n=1 Tax=Brienomyrus brachyistius TaxID=42636 RepID=UPI0020B303B4|nr:E3 ubiquitin-protein ligase TRIM39-like [Brienomyrus brachyistius]